MDCMWPIAMLVASALSPSTVHIFPFDTQSCPIILESFHFKEEDMMMHVLPVQAVQRRQYDGKWPSMSKDVQLKEWKPQGLHVAILCHRGSP